MHPSHGGVMHAFGHIDALTAPLFLLVLPDYSLSRWGASPQAVCRCTVAVRVFCGHASGIGVPAQPFCAPLEAARPVIPTLLFRLMSKGACPATAGDTGHRHAASLPVGANVYLMSRQFDTLGRPVAASLVIFTVFAAATTPLTLALMASAQISGSSEPFTISRNHGFVQSGLIPVACSQA
ncbi:MAG: hypothetical protein E6H67_02815 [Betaproteobacteria bacterium]|nr:MAG: hypothetical protein E6H67_02815 [Betaproteobacteria bacterium]